VAETCPLLLVTVPEAVFPLWVVTDPDAVAPVEVNLALPVAVTLLPPVVETMAVPEACPTPVLVETVPVTPLPFELVMVPVALPLGSNWLWFHRCSL